MKFRYAVLCIAMICLGNGTAFTQLTVDSVTLQGEVLVTNNADQDFIDGFLVNDFDNTLAVQASTGFGRPLPEFHSSFATVEAVHAANVFNVNAFATADVNFNLLQDDINVGGFASATGSATIDFTLSAPHFFGLGGALETQIFDPEFEAISTVSLIRIADGNLIDPVNDDVLASGSYRFSTTIDLSVFPTIETFDSPPLFFGEAIGDVSVSPSLTLTAVPEPSASLLAGFLASCIASLRRRPSI